MTTNDRAQHYQGIFIPLTTPFEAGGAIDWPALRSMVRFYARHRVAGFVPCGSTGEASTLSMDEHKAVISFVVEEAAPHGLSVIAATGSNSTADTVELTTHARNAGANACLVVTPYYLRPNLAGLLAHYAKVAEVGIDVVLYNIPARTGLNLPLEHIARLQEANPQIAGVKEATGDIQQLIDLAHRYAESPDFSVLSGEDSLLFDCIAHGGRGSISAAALVFTEEVVTLYEHLRDGRLAAAQALNRQLRPRVQALFCETNPVPLKEALHLRFGCSPTVRLPLGPASAQTRDLIGSLGLHREREK